MTQIVRNIYIFMSKKKNSWNTVTTFSKITALVLFVMFPVIGFYLGVWYQEKLDKPLIQQSSKGEISACAMDRKKCADGSYVMRMGPHREYAKCPEEKAMN